jgi:WXXGXW repeat (2 copies)
MTSRNISIVTVALTLAVVLSLAKASTTQEPPAQQQQGVDIQARGPVHEAFAQPLTTQPLQGQVVTQQPPDSIEELPPDERPQGDNVQWIPGYFAWDDDSSNFLWVSGCWRDVPPGRSWMPGHWQQIEGGWLWVSGFWMAANTQQVQYLPPPPPTLDQGPANPAPDDNNIYAPGCWVYRENRYLWRPGHWLAFRPNWVWIPAHYVWTPVGCLFVEDYWDYPLSERGLLFAPCRFDLRVWAGLRRPFVPQFVVDPDFLIGALFVNASHRHYYFGDYFEERYQKNFVAWTDYHPIRGVFDPNFSYYRHLHGPESGWENGVRELYRARRSGEIPRPPRTYALQGETIRSLTGKKTENVKVLKNVNLTHLQNVSVLAPLKEFNNTKLTHLGALGTGKKAPPPGTTLKLQAVPKEEHLREQKAATQLHDTAIERRQTEAKMLIQGGNPVKHTDPPHAVKLPVPQAAVHVAPPPAVVRTPPPQVTLPKHEERPIPKYEPPHPVSPPKKDKKG